MKIGDKVRFLNSIGGGIIARFEKGGVAIVTDDDGFDVPTLMSEIVVVGETTNLNLPKRNAAAAFGLEPEIEEHNDDEEFDPADRPITFQPKPIEREGGDVLNVFLAFVPTQPTDLLNSSIEVYIVNDTNYYVDFIYMQRELGTYRLLQKAHLQPNTKWRVATKERSALADLEELYFQGIAYKEEMDFLPQPTIDVPIKLNLRKFYKASSFVDTPFFNTPALLHTIIAHEEVNVLNDNDLLDLEEALNNKQIVRETREQAHREQVQLQADGTLVVDLHTPALLDNTSGFTPADILHYQVDHFKRMMDTYKNKVGQKIVFIHGKGEGVLRKAIITELRRKYKRCDFQDASFAEYGFGATQVTIKR